MLLEDEIDRRGLPLQHFNISPGTDEPVCEDHHPIVAGGDIVIMPAQLHGRVLAVKGPSLGFFGKCYVEAWIMRVITFG